MEKFTSYSQAIDYLTAGLPVFQHSGQAAYHPGLETSRMIDDAFGNPHKDYPVIHIAGTNGKGSTAHTIAAVLQCAGYKVGLYTSPHLLDFRERIRVDGNMIPQEAVTDFVNRYRELQLPCSPSFFEVTTIMAFEYFARQKVDIAVVEVGLGGRFDTTNVVRPVLSVITNISLDHTAILGNTLAAVAREKAGIIKNGVPVVVGEADGEVREVFDRVARDMSSPLTYASQSGVLERCKRLDSGDWLYESHDFGTFAGALGGDCQPHNTATVLAAIGILRDKGIDIDSRAVAKGFSSVCDITGFYGRWSVVSRNPVVIADTGHNPGGWLHISAQLKRYDCRRHLVLGFVGDKDVDAILGMLSGMEFTDFYLTAPSVHRALPVGRLLEKARDHGIDATGYSTVEEAYRNAFARADKGDMIFVGGSGFVVADFMAVAKTI